MGEQDDDIDLAGLDDAELAAQMHDDLYDGLADEIVEGTTILLDRGWGPDRVLAEALVEGMRIVGIDFRDGILFVPEVLLSANAMKAGMEILRPLLAETGAEPVGKVVIGTVKGDIHDIGKNLVAMMMEGAGFEVIDIGINSDVDKYLTALAEHQPDILGMSALLTTTMPYMKVVIDTMTEKGLRDDYIVLVGGAPLNEEFGTAVGADAYCRDAAVAAETARKLVDARRRECRASWAVRCLRCLARHRLRRTGRRAAGSAAGRGRRHLPARQPAQPPGADRSGADARRRRGVGCRPAGVRRLRRLRHGRRARPLAGGPTGRRPPARRALLRGLRRAVSASPSCTTPSRGRSSSPTSWPATSMRWSGRVSASTGTPNCATCTSATTAGSCCCRSRPTPLSCAPLSTPPIGWAWSSSTTTPGDRSWRRRSPWPCAAMPPRSAPDASAQQRRRGHLLARHPGPGQRASRTGSPPGLLCRTSFSGPSIGPSARPRSTPPTRTSPSGDGSARRATGTWGRPPASRPNGWSRPTAPSASARWPSPAVGNR